MIDAKIVAELRAATGAGIVDCKQALEETAGDMTRAAELLRKKGIAKAGNKAERATKEGLIHAYIHGSKVGAMIEVQCETDFVARTEQFQSFVHDVAMHVAAANPLYLTMEQVPAEVLEKEKEIALAEFAGSSKPREVLDKIAAGKLEKYYSETCLLQQPFVKDEDVTVGELLKQTIAKTGENIQIKRFVRFGMGE